MALHSLSLPCALLVLGCGSAAAVRPAQPAIPYDASVAAESANFVETGTAPFVMHWQPLQSAALEASLRQFGEVTVVRYDRLGLRLLDDCHLQGAYVPQTLPAYQGTTAVQDYGGFGIGAAPVAQVGIAQRTSSEFHYVVSGKWASLRATARRSELQGACQDATHFVRGAYTGAFSRASFARGSAQASAGLMGFAADATGGSQAALGAAGGDLSACAAPKLPSEDPRCSAVVRLELEPIQPSVIASVTLTSFRSADRKPGGLPWDGNDSAPDPALRVTSTSGSTARLPEQPDSWSWHGLLMFGDFELSDSLAITVKGTDVDALENDPMGELTLTATDLASGGSVERVLMLEGVQTGELTFQVKLQTVP